MARRQQSEVEEATVVAADGARLKAWSFHSLSGNGNAVLLLHGLSDNRMGMIGYAELLLSHGFSILMPDARGHGESGGELATYGMLEGDDVHRWLDWLREHQRPVCIFGFGESMGAALLLGSLSSETGFCAVAAESPFSTLREVAYDRVGQFFRLGPWLGRSVFRPVVEVAFQYARWKYGLDLEPVSPAAAVARSHVPVMLIHGREDHNIPIRHSRKITLDHPNLTLWEVPGADHCGAISMAPPRV